MRTFLRITLILSALLIFGCTQKPREEVFWSWFAENNLTYFENAGNLDPQSELAIKLSDKLKMVHPDLVWEIGELNDPEIRELTISADGIKDAFPAVIKLTDRAPEISNWRISAFRQRVAGNDLSIQMGNYSVSYQDIFFHHVSENDKIGIKLYIKDYTGDGLQQNAIFILMDALLGEYDTETKIDWIEWHDLSSIDTVDLLPFPELRNLVDQSKN